MPNDMQSVTWPGWQTVRLIGQGSFGTVYEINRQVFDDTEKAALKVISIPQNKSEIEELYSDGYDEESITSTFQSHLKSIVAEYSLTRKMNDCVNIVTCEDVRYVQHDDGIGWDIFIKMELLTPLAKSLPSVIPEEMVINLGKDLCQALMECRKHEIVHRDIKPQNIFLSEAGDYKLGDFGIAKTVEKTTGGTKIGTYKYMAPEVYNNQPYGCGADIYSLGMVLYWLLNERRMPFLPLPPEKLKVGMEEDARRRRMSGEPLPPPAHGSDLLKRIVLKACAFDPHKRYQSADQMHKDMLAAKQEWRAQHPEISGMQLCPVCGSAVEKDCRFCVFCGTSMSEPVQAPAIEPVSPMETIVQVAPVGKEVVIVSQIADSEEEMPAQTQTCAHCGAALVPDKLFCTQCGMRREEPKQPEPEEKVAEPETNADETMEQVTEDAPVEKECICEREPLCPRCGAILPPVVRFCIQCGVRLETASAAEKQAEETLTCAGCGAVLEPGNRFCTQCGRPL